MFFEKGSDRTLFDGLNILDEKELCENNMGKFPVISISLKGVEAACFDMAKRMLRGIIGREAMRFQFLMQSSKLSDMEQQQYRALVNVGTSGSFTMSDEILRSSLLTLSQLLQKHYEKNTIILIDEYDVPLDNAYQLGYYDEMVELIRSLFGQALKTNDSLHFAVLTGCLRISRESIFTGLNNFKVYTIKDVRFSEYFGFTDVEVRKMLSFYGFMDHYQIMKEWYDGYKFGDVGIYCPWDVINYCDDLRDASVTGPRNYWVNTSSNDIIRKFVSRANAVTRREIEDLIDGGSIKKRICQELTYRDLDSNIDNLWSILFTTGYLTQRSILDNDMTELAIPNKEINWIFVEQIQEWFKRQISKDSQNLEKFCQAFLENDIRTIEEGFTSYLGKTISIRDTTAKNMKENFYHGILLGLLGFMDDWIIMSNAEAGEGYSDITIEIESQEIGVVIEIKYADNAAFDTGCKKALQQIKDQHYDEILIKDGMKTIYRYGIACYKKRCRVISG